MKRFSRSRRYLFARYSLIFGRAIFFIGLTSMAFSIYFGVESVNHSNAVTPKPFIFQLSLLLLLIWGVSISISVILSLNLSCDNCGAKLCKVPHGYKSLKKRNWIITFFYPDDIYEKKFVCFNCSAEYKL